MWEFIATNITAIGSLLLAIATSVLTVLSKSSSSKNKAVYEAVQFVVKILPRLIAFSESSNAGKTGATKKEFVMTFVETILSGRGVIMTDAIRSEISENIDAIVNVTKEIHTTTKEGKAENEENLRNDIDGVTGLRVNS